ncbi:RteC domain-containing protein [Flagellimonas sp. CMM7]|uniref:RteC domain-containing protein n=1 Tax=Flagellimonas sp. CMM7 TaxID=2654676 RepID=UPI0013D26076|nr:RteC domain-containing protein [Flagellimonas sp. CMM7]UII81110.1 RteC domain-containing protein [Flagellimonas sp. CMM7]
MERKMHINDLESQIKEIESRNNNILEVCKEIILACKTHLLGLRAKVANQGFQNENDEIHFFKFVKQTPLTNLIYYSQVLDFEASFPMNKLKTQKKYIKKKTEDISDLFLTHSDFIRYTRLKQTHFDKQFFTRKYSNFYCGIAKPYYILDPIFNTSHDYLLAKISALQRMSIYLQNRLRSYGKIDKTSNLHWTSSKVSLTELVYALHHSGAINNGKADIKQIANAFEKIFNFSLGDFYRTYIEICSRKKDKIKFLDELSYIMYNKMEQGNA